MGFSFWAPWNFCTKFQASPSNRCQPGLIIWFQAAVQKYESFILKGLFSKSPKVCQQEGSLVSLHSFRQTRAVTLTWVSAGNISANHRDVPCWHLFRITLTLYPYLPPFVSNVHRHLGSFTVIFVVYISQVVRDRLRPWLWRPNQVFQAKPLFFSDPNQVGFLRKPNQSAGEKQKIQPTQT